MRPRFSRPSGYMAIGWSAASRISVAYGHIYCDHLDRRIYSMSARILFTVPCIAENSPMFAAFFLGFNGSWVGPVHKL